MSCATRSSTRSGRSRWLQWVVVVCRSRFAASITKVTVQTRRGKKFSKSAASRPIGATGVATELADITGLAHFRLETVIYRFLGSVLHNYHLSLRRRRLVGGRPRIWSSNASSSNFNSQISTRLFTQPDSQWYVFPAQLILQFADNSFLLQGGGGKIP